MFSNMAMSRPERMVRLLSNLKGTQGCFANLLSQITKRGIQITPNTSIMMIYGCFQFALTPPATVRGIKIRDNIAVKRMTPITSICQKNQINLPWIERFLLPDTISVNFPSLTAFLLAIIRAMYMGIQTKGMMIHHIPTPRRKMLVRLGKVHIKFERVLLYLPHCQVELANMAAVTLPEIHALIRKGRAGI